MLSCSFVDLVGRPFVQGGYKQGCGSGCGDVGTTVENGCDEKSSLGGIFQDMRSVELCDSPLPSRLEKVDTRMSAQTRKMNTWVHGVPAFLREKKRMGPFIQDNMLRRMGPSIQDMMLRLPVLREEG